MQANSSDKFAGKGISGSTLKWIAMITMIIDHFAVGIFIPMMEAGQLSTFDYSSVYTAYTISRAIGRLAFPIFCFLLVEGFFYTSNVKKYAIRLGIFAIISEVPFNLVIDQTFWNLGYQNVFFTLLIGLVTIWSMSKVENNFLKLIPALLGIVLAELLHTDYGAFGVLLIAVLYQYRELRLWQSIIGGLMVAWEITAPISFVLSYFYNGLKGRYNAKWLYWIYPVHLLIFGLIGRAILNA
ncbi:hypothetical protein EF384_07215 [Aerococcus agrisoli]|uniref:Conjugal transfer protein TraX n=1 Tax=Aerococcus agrisoli TaxID=2487350 RepID=A0A3N4G7E0_9LACT|nr:TraX family protein [Aerococcus agrisoli]RPA58673.1 hypothetical protein EF384_07215 [Aerococcus agrisoli]